MSSFHPINPKPFLKTLVNKQVIIRLKWNKTEYKGRLLSIDNYMNLQLDDTYEVLVEDGQKKEELIGEIFIRCNNVLFIREDVGNVPVKENKEEEEKEEKEEEEDSKMEEN